MTATDLGYQPLTADEEAEVLADVESDGPEDPTAAMVGRLLATVDAARARAASALQGQLDKDCREFAENVALVCPDQPPHRPADLFGNLDDCYRSDKDDGVNVAYGGVYAVLHVARELGVEVEMRFPDLEGSMER